MANNMLNNMLKNMQKKLNVAVVALLMGLGTLVQADTISFTDSVSGSTDWSQQLGLTQFNPAWGNLLSVTIDLSASFSSNFTITNTGSSTYGASSTAQKNLNIFLGSSAVDQAIDANNPNGQGNYWLQLVSNSLFINGLAPGGTRSTSSARTGSTDPGGIFYTDGTTLGYFTGTGTTLLDLYTQGGFTMTIYNGSQYDSSSTTSATATGIVTYDFTPAPVPEPSTVLLFGLGFGGLVLIQRRRRTR